MIEAEIVDIEVHDVRFPTSMWQIGNDSLHTNPNHACTYVIIHTNTKYKGYGIATTLGRGNEFVVQTCKLLFRFVKKRMTTEIYSNFASFWKQLTTDVELRWLGAECGVVHLATAAIVNALWDLWARIEDKPVWKLLMDMTPEQLVSTVDFRYIRDVVTEEEAIEMLKKGQSRKEERKKILESKGHPAYTADIGWSFNNQQIRSACKKFKKLEFKEYKIYVGPTIPVSWKKCNLIRNVIGKRSDKILIVDANQFWDRDEAIFSVKSFNKTRPYFIEEPTSPDDVLGHVAIRAALKELKYPVRVSCGETCANRVLFKQFLKFDGVDFWNINVGRLGGINEALAVYFMAKKHSIPVWGHAGEVGSGEMIQHLQIWNFICLSEFTDIKIEYKSQQHGYFEDPVFIRNAAYLLPNRPGFSTQLKNKCIMRWSYPEGTRWKYLFVTKHFKNELIYQKKL
ncbi:PREDICTED: mitochondrial enolase superfamily member 1-like isoform X1 [Acromyrmex echinatior]|uniref:Mitochondrial enolase superfamily member 1 n=1 Tax=Acromyrmex echinatior TaxID=103372 RepID=F4WH64_ACREC|nr:PREDICTED: mitochondrial enolase superfamily member 1-like isoform X1 [Acromyrmex echinatior]EGI66543.1 Mitochondrial enolase superfamily member 1 [Acromyrmex echinatior]